MKPQNWVWLVLEEATTVSQGLQALSSVVVTTSSLLNPQTAAFVLRGLGEIQSLFNNHASPLLGTPGSPCLCCSSLARTCRMVTFSIN